ncbi:MAG TPA: response regulator [Chitinophagales bacterium]|nr:response regulator [Chitinophagales bacterium]
MNLTKLNLLLADDDSDDRMFFKEAIEELPIEANVTTVRDGVELMHHLNSNVLKPHALFLDLNMPRKNGFDCLAEIKKSEALNHIPVIIYSTSFDTEVVNVLYENGAQHYVCKPGDFLKLKQVIYEALTMVAADKTAPPSKDNFVIQVR